MSSHLVFVCNSKGSNDNAIIVYDGDIVYQGTNTFHSQDVFGWLNFADAEYKTLYELTDEDFANWETIIYK